jgi:hypothetical protein
VIRRGRAPERTDGRGIRGSRGSGLTVGFFIGAVGVGGILLVPTGMLLLMQAL